MSKMTERVAYLKGLAEGIGIGDDDQGKLISAIIETLDVFASEYEANDQRLQTLSEYVEEIDSDVSDLEEAFFSDDDDDMEMFDDEDDDDDEPDDGLIQYECPKCGTLVFYNAEGFDMEPEHVCPNCGEKIFGDEEDGEDE